MAKYLNTLTGRIVNIKDIDSLPEENKKTLKLHSEEVSKPDVLKAKKYAKD